MRTKMRRRGKMKLLDKIALAAIAGMFLFFAAMVTYSFVQDSSNKDVRQKAAQEVASALASPSPTSTPPLVNPPVGKSGGTSNSAHMEAVDAAVMAFEAISGAQFQLPSERDQTIEQWVFPGLVNKYRANLSADGPRLAQAWGWTSTYEAHLYAQYGVTTKMYKVDRFKNGRAVIRLYTLSRHQARGVTPPPENQVVIKRYRDQPGLTIVKMRRQYGKWWYAGYANPSPSQRPQFGINDTEDHLTSAEAIRRYKHFLKGFSHYVYSHENG
jgi:hypothetical protein